MALWWEEQLERDSEWKLAEESLKELHALMNGKWTMEELAKECAAMNMDLH